MLIGLSGLIIAAYLILIAVFSKGWSRIPLRNSGHIDISGSVKVSVVICCKNESGHIPALIRALSQQTYSHFELIWVNDHSEDNTPDLMHGSAGVLKDVKVIDAIACGKKKAQKEGIISASGEVIITTDADCIPETTWIECMVSHYLENKSDLIIAPVKINPGETCFTHLQQLEFLTLVASGMGAAGAGMPIFCNAANMAFRKDAWLESLADLHEEEISGDDVFLLLSIKKRKGNISVLKHPGAMVNTEAQADISGFFRQRRRWLSKSSRYTDGHIILTGMIVAAVNMLLLASAATALIIPSWWWIFAGTFLLKYCADSFFLLKVQPFFRTKFNPLLNLMLSVSYPFYALVTGIMAFGKKQKNW